MTERDRRVAPRVAVILEGLISPNGRARKEVKIQNISESGILIRSLIPVFSLSRVQISLNLDGKPFEGQAICVRVTSAPPWEAGLHFVDVDDESRKALVDFITKRLQENESN